MSRSDTHPPEEICEAAMAVGNALARCEKYALVGGSACAVLGSTRATEDVDLVVLRGGTANARRLLRESSDFEVQPRTNYTTYKAKNIEVEILTPPTLFKEPFDHNTEIITIEDAKVLKPALLLNAKCGSINGRSTETKKDTDAQDIGFLLDFCAENPDYLPKATEVPNATKEFVGNHIHYYGGQEDWVRAGYNFETDTRVFPGELSIESVYKRSEMREVAQLD
ncbi:hypothetical protein BDV38DRAFT_291149 [Aspergillus pseudotamarii]|uniref:Uncharacterized protein n=1 Tax=Aspergillus pseudotamarii TaxID=132259 RepID=A0A5N6SZ33_ASPPS|nr:uncharacterized protein BDV38DRAFT_291149 [Aspergillus pseudotamarii]KAE8139892.1 hypothetical protein BDV38DRAFT_291149 [Aspergillus pseudotamarii]